MGYRQLTHGERYAMANMLHQGYSYRAIARVLGRSVSTVSRERRRNATTHDGAYRAEKAQQYAMARTTPHPQEEPTQPAGMGRGRAAAAEEVEPGAGGRTPAFAAPAEHEQGDDLPLRLARSACWRATVASAAHP